MRPYRLAAIFFGCAALVTVSSAVSAATPAVTMLRDCSLVTETPCIVSIAATGTDGRVVTASLTGWNTPSENPALYANVIVDEYRIPGFTFEGTAADLVIPRIAYRPLGSQTCNVAGENCQSNLEELAIVVGPSWLHDDGRDAGLRLIQMPHRPSDLVCGTAEQPTVCYRGYNFNTNIAFDVTLRVPNDFRVAVSNAQGEDFSLSSHDVGTSSHLLSLHIATVRKPYALFAPLLPDPLGTSAYADFWSDSSAVWLFGARSREGAALGACAGIPAVSVSANSVYQSTPRWNARTQSIEVDLAAPHLTPEGAANVGFFTASISQAMGKCLWGIDLSTKTRAVVSVTDTDGTSEVATESSRFDGTNYILTARNFHYSSPLVSFKLADPAPAVEPSVAASPAPFATKAAVGKLKVITCVKGKTRKTVKGVNPKCPLDWKRAN